MGRNGVDDDDFAEPGEPETVSVGNGCHDSCDDEQGKLGGSRGSGD